MQVETEEILEWASQKLGVRFRDPGERRQRALAELVDSGFFPEPMTASAISILFHYEAGEPLAAPFLTHSDLYEIQQDRLRERVIARLQTLPDLPLDQRIGMYHALRQQAEDDPWLLQRVCRAAGLVVGNVGHIEPSDPRRWLVLLPSEAVLKRPAPPPQSPDPYQFLHDEAKVSRPTVIPPTGNTISFSKAGVMIVVGLAIRMIIHFGDSPSIPRQDYAPPYVPFKQPERDVKQRLPQLRPRRPARPAYEIPELPSLPIVPQSPSPKPNEPTPPP